MASFLAANNDRHGDPKPQKVKPHQGIREPHRTAMNETTHRPSRAGCKSQVNWTASAPRLLASILAMHMAQTSLEALLGGHFLNHLNPSRHL